MKEITVNIGFKNLCPQFRGAALMAVVTNPPTPSELWDEMLQICQKIQNTYDIHTLKQTSGIEATRAAYKTMGKDPSRYRPACEQLARRVIQGKGLNSIDTLADISNIISLYCQYSTAALDADKIEGNKIELGIGKANEPYEGIGRGVLNIENLPVYRDAIGGIATPTSDNVRTMTTPNTRNLLFLINAYDGNMEKLEDATLYTQQLLRQYANAQELQIIYY